jgi:hypothetical protein
VRERPLKQMLLPLRRLSFRARPPTGLGSAASAERIVTIMGAELQIKEPL